MKKTSLAVAFLAFAFLTGTAHATDVPAVIQPPAGHKEFSYQHAVGVQIYACNGSAWSFVAPRANLYNHRGKLKMIHFAGPTWQHKDGSSVVGQVVAPSPVAGTIPWLLLSAKSTAPGPFGDKLTKTTYIQRINTTGGVIPAPETCNAASAGTQAEVPYTADYVFFKASKR
jgi:hypothetical protein